MLPEARLSIYEIHWVLHLNFVPLYRTVNTKFSSNVQKHPRKTFSDFMCHVPCAIVFWQHQRAHQIDLVLCDFFLVFKVDIRFRVAYSTSLTWS